MINLQVLGPLTVTGADGGPVRLRPRQRALLTMLLIQPRRPWPVDTLALVLWANRRPADPLAETSHVIARLRQTLDRGEVPRAMIARAGGGYLADPAPGVLDLERYQDSVARARQARAAGDVARATALTEEALACWADPRWGFRDAPDVPAVHGVIAALEEERRTVEGQLADQMLAQGRHAELLPALQARSREFPGDEGACARLMQALLAAGREVEATSAFHRTAQALGDELGVRPSPLLRDLLATALRDL